MFLYGLTPMLTPLVVTHNPGNLDEAVKRAKLVETGYHYAQPRKLALKQPPEPEPIRH